MVFMNSKSRLYDLYISASYKEPKMKPCQTLNCINTATCFFVARKYQLTTNRRSNTWRHLICQSPYIRPSLYASILDTAAHPTDVRCPSGPNSLTKSSPDSTIRYGTRCLYHFLHFFSAFTRNLCHKSHSSSFYDVWYEISS